MVASILIPNDWSSILVPDTPLLEIFIRGSAVYLFLFFTLRLILKREAAGLGISDLLVVVLLADAVQNGMADDYRSIPDALLLAATIIGWDWFLSYLAFRFPSVRSLIRPRPILLIDHGQIIAKSMHRELLTPDEILGRLREQGIERVEDVKQAWMESDGMITAIPEKGPRRRAERRKRF
jgi:uncharacterized membrane protein YcaP (DUF421 family)